MPIIKVRGKNGHYYAVESTSRYVPGKGSRPIKKYLGRYDEDTGELIPSSGKRGRKKKTQTQEAPEMQNDSNDREEMYRDVKRELERAEAEVLKLTGELEEARERQKELAAKERRRKRIMASVRQLLDELEDLSASGASQ